MQLGAFNELDRVLTIAHFYDAPSKQLQPTILTTEMIKINRQFEFKWIKYPERKLRDPFIFSYFRKYLFFSKKIETIF